MDREEDFIKIKTLEDLIDYRINRAMYIRTYAQIEAQYKIAIILVVLGLVLVGITELIKMIK